MTEPLQHEELIYSRKRKQDLHYEDTSTTSQNNSWLNHHHHRDHHSSFLDQLPTTSTSSTTTNTTTTSSQQQQLGFEFLPPPPLPNTTEEAADEFISYNDHQHRQQQQEQLRLNDLQSIHDRNQQQLIQSWVGGRQSPQTSFSPTTPAFFSPSFLESLQNDDDPTNTSTTTRHSSFIQSTHTLQHEQQPSSSSSSSSLSAWPPIPSSHQQQSYEFSTSMDSMIDRARTNNHHSNHNNNNNNNNEPFHLFHSSSTSILSPPQSPSTSSPFIRSNSSSLRQRPIPEEEDDFNNNRQQQQQQQQLELRSLKAGLATARIIQSTANASRLKPLVQTYLQSTNPIASGEKTVIILTSKVAQKSYGTEKRFLCPPPTAILMGTTWWKPKMNESNEYGPPLLTVCISGETTSQSGQVEWYNSNGAAVGQTGHPKSSSSLTSSTHNTNQQQRSITASSFRDQQQQRVDVDWYHNHEQDPLMAGRCVAKNLYINDADEKRKRVECLIRIQLGDGSLLGTLASKGIKVISKPSKKRQSVKNMELCIHHGTTVSLFNRIRSQTVSTKYLGVSCGSAFSPPGYHETKSSNDMSSIHQGASGTCFVARTTSWDPFVIWIVDTTRTPNNDIQQENESPEDYIGHNVQINNNRNVNYPPPPAIALKNTTDQPIAIHYNQHIVLQCLTTGLVSPVMIIRKVDKASTVVGGARAPVDQPAGGEFGDEMLGDPVSQLHKVALQIVQDPSQAVNHHQQQQQQQQQQQNGFGTTPCMDPLLNHQQGVDIGGLNNNSNNHHLNDEWMLPKSQHPITYLACLNDMVGMHKTVERRKPVMSWEDITSQEASGKVVRKRRVSTDQIGDMEHMFRRRNNTLDPSTMTLPKTSSNTTTNNNNNNGLDDYDTLFHPHRARSHSISIEQNRFSRSNRRMSTASTSSTGSSSSTTHHHGFGAYWSEDVSDAAVWTIVGTDCATFKFWAPQPTETSTMTPFPSLSHFSLNGSSNSNNNSNGNGNGNHDTTTTTTTTTVSGNTLMTLHGENFTRDLQVWFGDVKASHTEYRGREIFLCHVPPRHELMESMHIERNLNNNDNNNNTNDFKLPILLVRGEGVIMYKTNQYYHF